MATYEEWITSQRLPWLGTKGRAIVGAFAAVLGDRALEWAKQAFLEHLPEKATAASNALTASERQIEPGPTEANAALATRLVRAVAQWRLAGAPLGLLLALYYAEFAEAVIVQQNGRGYNLSGTSNLDDIADLTTQPAWYIVTTLGLNPAIPASADGRPAIASGTVPWWTFDVSHMDTAGNQFTSRFAILFPVGNTVDLSVQANLDRIRRVIQRWRPAKATCVTIIDVLSGAVWGWPASQNWGGFSWGGSIATYSP